MPKVNVESADERDAETVAVYRLERRRPWRILPLALLAIAGAVAVTGSATAMFRDLSDHRYAAEILRDQVASADHRDGGRRL